MTKKASRRQKQRAGKSPLHPLSPDEAPRGAMQAGRSPEPENKHARRTATKRRLTEKKG